MTTLTEVLDSTDHQLLAAALEELATDLQDRSQNDFYGQQERTHFTAQAARALELQEAILEAHEVRLITRPRP